MEKYVFLVIIVISIIILFLIFVRLIWRFKIQLEGARFYSVKVASAGAIINDTPNVVKIQSLNEYKFYDDKNSLIDIDKFNTFWVKGRSMLLCGIRENDLLLTQPVNIDTLSFEKPHVFVLEREKDLRSKAKLKNDLAEYKIRRTWMKVSFSDDDLLRQVKKIMESEIFLSLKKKNPDSFLSEDQMLSDFQEERMKRYKEQYPNCEDNSDGNHIAIISTTLKRTKGNKVTFSLHPARLIKGEVIYSFHWEENVSIN